MKIFGDVSSMASFIAAAAVAAATSGNKNPNNPGSNLLPLPSMNFQFNPAQLPGQAASLQQELISNPTSAQAAILAAAYKYNTLYSNMQQPQAHLNPIQANLELLNNLNNKQQQQQQLQQSYTANLAKYMSFCYNKPAEYIQRLLAEQATSSFSENSLLENSLAAQQAAAAAVSLQYQNLSNGSSGKSFRYHPYMKASGNEFKANQQPITVITNNSIANSPVYSPSESNSYKKSSKQFMNSNRSTYSRSPSPVSSPLSSPVAKSSNNNSSSMSNRPSSVNNSISPSSPAPTSSDNNISPKSSSK